MFFQLLQLTIIFHLYFSKPFYSNNFSPPLSSGLKNVLKKLPFQNLGKKIPNRVDSSFQSLNIDESFKIKVTIFNGDIGLGGMRIKEIYHEKSPLDSSAYSVKTHYENGIEPLDDPIPSSGDESSSKKFIECDYNFYHNIYHQINKTIEKSYNKIVRYRRFLFGLYKDTLYTIVNYANADYVSKIFPESHKDITNIENATIVEDGIEKTVDDTKYLISINNVLDVFVSSRYDGEIPYVIMLLKNNTICIFTLNTVQYKYGIKYRPWLVKYFTDSFNVQDGYGFKTFYQAKIDQDKLFISSDSKGIEVYKISEKIDTDGNKVKRLIYEMTMDIENVKYEISDFVLNKNTIYALVKDYGLAIYNKSQTYPLHTKVEHPQMKQIVHYIHPFSGNEFIGIFIDQKESKEFFIELYIANEFKPRVNQVFMSENKITSMLSTDFFFNYFYDKTNNKIYSIRKAIFNLVPTTIFTYNIEGSNFQNGELIPYYNSSISRIQPTLKKDNKLASIRIFLYRQHNLNCTLSTNGEYVVILDKLTDSCQSSMDSYDQTAICHQGYKYTLKSFGMYISTRTKILLGVFIFVLVMLAIISFYYIWKKYKALKEHRLKIIVGEKENRETIYMQLPETTESQRVDTIPIANSSERKSIQGDKKTYDLAPSDSMITYDRNKQFNPEKTDVFTTMQKGEKGLV